MKRVIKILFVGAIAIVLYGLWYQNQYSMDTAESQEFYNPDLDHKIMIATQGSNYKSKLTGYIVDALKDKNIFIKVIDISQLSSFDTNNYSAIVIIHTWEMWKAPAEVVTFLDQHLGQNIFLIGTSGSGNLIVNGVDGITSASLIEDAKADADKAVNWINDKIKNK